MITALGELKDLSWKLTFLGDGPLRGDCIELAESLGLQDRIDFSGYSESVEEALTQHDIFALITNWEGFPRSILEAMAASLPVIVTDVGGSRESVLDGVTGTLVAGGDVENLTTALRSLITDHFLRRKMGEAGRERYLKHFTFETMFSNYAELYCELIEDSRSQTIPESNETRPARTVEKPSHAMSTASTRRVETTKATGIQAPH
jgi:glycosyltransferase involved in cell wall biosynthesis